MRRSSMASSYHLRIGLLAALLFLASVALMDSASAQVIAPAGYNTPREGIERGKVELVEYDSKALGIKRRMNIYTPRGFDSNTKYPVLYLLHGRGDNETTGWMQQGRAN